MSTELRHQALDPATPSERLAELIRLPGDRGSSASDAGWCREYVAANPNADESTLDELSRDSEDWIVRHNVAKNPSTPHRVLTQLAYDPHQLVASAAIAALSAHHPKTVS